MGTATHQCSACLKKTIEDYPDEKLPKGYVPAGSVCGPRPTLGHHWNTIQQGEKDFLLNQASIPIFHVFF